MLIGAGSGVVPLMSILRTRARVKSPVAARLLYSSRQAADIIYREELHQLVCRQDGLSLTHTLTRGVPDGWTGESRRVDQDMLRALAFPAAQAPQIFICGPTTFVEVVADHLIALGYPAAQIKTERFGPTSTRS
jgi:ferredoxin-NADP reductase